MLNAASQKEYRNLVLSPFFKVGMLKVLPMGTIAGLKITELDEQQCKVTVPYKYINKNPFNTTYWAVLGMAAEMASGAMVQMYTHKLNPSVSMFVTGCEGKFLKRAVGITTFICTDGQLIADTIQKAIDTREPQTIQSNVKGYDKDNVLLVDFNFEWSLKARIQ
ncbi:MAG: DUF4442 domain-containing protein [Sphingobacteriales bacterium]|nr:DUF4442 domain-containing protein [Sphingobacteriales bacterium]